MHAILYRDPEAQDSNDWRWRLVSGSKIVASGQAHASPSKAFRAVQSIVRGVVKELHQPFAQPEGIMFFRFTQKDGSIKVVWS